MIETTARRLCIYKCIQIWSKYMLVCESDGRNFYVDQNVLMAFGSRHVGFIGNSSQLHMHTVCAII